MPFDSKTAATAGEKSKRGQSKTTLELQSSFNTILSNNVDNIDKWINDVAEKEPAKALDLILKMSSFIMPKMRAIQSEDLGKQCDCEDLSKLSDEELNERLRQANRVFGITPIQFVSNAGN